MEPILHAFEPDPAHFSSLEQLVRSGALPEDAVLHQAAAWTHDGHVSFRLGVSILGLGRVLPVPVPESCISSLLRGSAWPLQLQQLRAAKRHFSAEHQDALQ